MAAIKLFHVSTDESDYSPYSWVEITADNFSAGATIQFQVTHVVSPGPDGIWGTADDVLGTVLSGSAPWTVTDGGAGDGAAASGTIITSWYVNPDAAGQQFLLTATNEATGQVATATFTDSAPPPLTPPPSASNADLTASGNSGSVGDGVFQAAQIQGTGAGVFPAFVQIGHSGTEQGYNTDHRPEQFNEGNDTNHNHSILLSRVPIVTGDGTGGTNEGTDYREFLFDANEGNKGNNPFLSLDALQIWQERSGSLTGFNTSGSGFGAPGEHLVYNLDAGGDHWVALNAGLSHGSGQSDMHVLIPNYLFDPNIPYVVLYSAFGYQGDGWRTDGGNEEWGVQGGGNGSGGGPTSALNIEKHAMVPGDTADTAGEVITYSITVANIGNLPLTGVTVTDPSVNDLTRGPDIAGNNDNVLDVGEEWSFSAHHTVTQDDLDSDGGGRGAINNTATADSDQTGPDTSSASVPVAQNPAFQIDKAVASITSTDEVQGTTTIDAAGDVINYTITVHNTGNTTLTGVVVTDPQATVVTPVLDHSAPVPNSNAQVFIPIMDGDYNLGDNNNNGVVDPTDQNNVRDPGETWQFAYVGDLSNDNIHDPGETWTAYNLGDTNRDGIHQTGETWVGDTNQNGIEDPGERWQFQNVWDTNNNGLQDPGENWQYTNVGDDNHNGVQDPGETFVYYNIGDTNQNGIEDPGETFQYYNAGDTNHNGVEDNGETFQYVVTDTVPGVDANNDGFNDGDTNQDGKLNVGETWQYAYSHTATQADIDNRDTNGVPTVQPGLTHDNTATVTADQGISASDSASVPVDQHPHLAVTKTASIPDADHDGKIDSPADDITYTYTVFNDGNMTLTSVNLTDSVVGALTSHTETGGTGTNGDGTLDVGETWTYTAVYDVQQADIDNRGNVDGTADDNIHNTASVTTAQGAGGSASADVPIDYRPHLEVTKAASIPDADQDGKIDSPADDITYTVTVVNDGNVTLTNVQANDSVVGALTAHTDTGAGTHGDGNLDVGETWTYTAVYDVQQADIDNRGNVDGTADDNIHNTATVTTNEGAGGSASADVPIDYHPSVILTKDASVPGGTADANETIEYTIAVANNGNVTLTNPVVTDNFASNLHGLDANEDGFNDGDANHDGKLSVGETWQYVANHVVTQEEVNAGGTIDNTASVTTDQGASSSDSASVPVTPQNPGLTLGIAALGYHDLNGNNVADAGDTIDFAFTETNTGNVTLTNIGVADLDGTIQITGSPVASLAVGAADNTTVAGTHVINGDDVGNGYFDDEAVANADQVGNATATVHAVLHDLMLL